MKDLRLVVGFPGAGIKRQKDISQVIFKLQKKELIE
jgi:hypothetical protein